MQEVRIIFIECIYTSGIIGQILLCLTPKRCQRCSMMLGFHCIEVIGSCKYFHFTKMVLVMELKINSGFLTSCKHCYSSRADVAVKHCLSQSDGNPCPISNLNSLSISSTLCSAFVCTDFFPRGLSLSVLPPKGVGFGSQAWERC